MTRVRVLYFASLRDAAGMDGEWLDSNAATLAELHAECQARHRFGLPRERLRVAQAGAFAAWSDAVQDGAEIAFIPPVSGG